MKKRILFMGDLHTGQLVGLTPPEIHSTGTDRFKPVRFELWNAFAEIVDSLRPIDITIVNGDAIEGKGERSGGTELILNDRIDQAKYAQKCIEYTDAREILMTYGTPYHTGKNQDMEDIIANNLNCIIKSKLFLEINGVNFNIRHFVGNTTVPYSKGTAISKEWLANYMWNQFEDYDFWVEELKPEEK